jgi:hypothetical protein
MMKTRTARMFSAMVVAIMLMFVGDVVWSISGSTIGSTQQTTYPISFDQASTIAQDTAPKAIVIGTPKLISYQGTVAYVVTFDRGMIYVEATTGRILLNTVSTAMVDGQHD